MAGSNLLLDTNVMAAILNKEPGIEKRLMGTTIHLSCIALGELYFGAYKSTRVADNLQRIAQFVEGYSVLMCDQPTADRYGQIKVGLRQKGRPIPENDIWIAAMALQYDLTLVTRDAHFKEVDGLSLESW